MAACNKKREGKDFRMTEKTKVMCSRHFRSSDLKKSLNGRVYVKDNVVPSRFLILFKGTVHYPLHILLKWCQESPQKRKAPAVRFPSQATTKKKTTKPSTSAVTCSYSSKFIWTGQSDVEYLFFFK